MMNPSDLKKMLPALQTQSFVGASDDEIRSYIRIYFSLYQLVTVNALEDEYGEASIYEIRLRDLFRILYRRLGTRSHHLQKIRIHNLLSFLLSNLPFMQSEVDEEAYWEEVEDNLEACIAAYQPDAVSSQDLFCLLHLICYQWYGVVEEEGEDEIPPLTFLRDTLRRWSETLSPSGIWEGISVIEAFQRLSMMNCNLACLGDHRYDELISKVEKSYQRQIILWGNETMNSNLTETEINGYTFFFDLVRQSLLSEEQTNRILNRITALMEKQHLPAHSPLALQCRSLIIENSCIQISQQIQNQVFEMA